MSGDGLTRRRTTLGIRRKTSATAESSEEPVGEAAGCSSVAGCVFFKKPLRVLCSPAPLERGAWNAWRAACPAGGACWLADAQFAPRMAWACCFKYRLVASLRAFAPASQEEIWLMQRIFLACLSLDVDTTREPAFDGTRQRGHHGEQKWDHRWCQQCLITGGRRLAERIHLP